MNNGLEVRYALISGLLIVVQCSTRDIMYGDNVSMLIHATHQRLHRTYIYAVTECVLYALA